MESMEVIFKSKKTHKPTHDKETTPLFLQQRSEKKTPKTNPRTI